MYKQFFLFFVFCSIIIDVSPAQDTSFRFTHLTPADGLASTTVVDITQDSHGFIWIGSQDGISRYDGRNFRHFRPNPKDSLSLSSLEAQYLSADKHGGVWITITDAGLNYYDPVLEGFRKYGTEHGLPSNQRYIEVSIDDENKVWAATDNTIFFLDFETDRFKPEDGQREGSIYRLSAKNNGELLYFHQSESGEIFIGRRDHTGAYSYEPVTRTLNPSGSHPYRMHIFSDDSGTEWLVNQDLIAKKSETDENWEIIRPQNSGCLANLREAVIDNRGFIWAKSTESLCRLNPDTKESTIFTHNPQNPASILPIRSGADSRIYIDRQGVLWIAHFASGISKIDLYSGGFTLYNSLNKLPSNEVISVLEANDGTFWAGVRMLGNSLVHFNRNGNVIRRYGTTRFDAPSGRTVADQLSHPHAFALTESRDGSIWVGTGSSTTIFGGLNRIRPGSTSITRFKHDSNDPNSLPDNNITALTTDGSNRVWFLSSSEHIHWINPASERITKVELPESSGTGSTSNQLLYTDSNGDVWIKKSGHSSLFHINHETADIRNVNIDFIENNFSELITGEINAIHEDNDGDFWIGTNLGFGNFNSETGEIYNWYSDENLIMSTNEIAGIQSDENGNLWLSTINGVLKFNPLSELLTHFGYDRGLQGNIFSSRVNHSGSSGNIYFGGAGGLNVFKPDLISTNPISPDVVFTGLHLDGRAVEPGEEAPITESLLTADKITIDPSITTLTIDFAALHFANPLRNEYRYRLEGFDNEWLFGGTAGSATYTNLSPGEYTFRLMASNRDGVWSDGNNQIKIITVLPPWWRTWWAYGFYFIIFGFAVFGADRVQRRRLLYKEREKNRERELAQAREIEKAYKNLEEAHENLKIAQDQLVQQEKLASLGQLTAGIAHEIKNPLNFVNNFSEVSLELVEEAREEIRQRTYDRGLERKNSPFEGGSERSEQGDERPQNIALPQNFDTDPGSVNTPLNPLSRGEAGSSPDPDLILEILDDIEANLSKILEHGSRADSIVKSMLMHSRSGSGKLEATDLNKMLKESANLVYHGMKASGNSFDAEVIYELDESINNVPLIAEDMSRVILNLCNNAFDAMREKALSPNALPGGEGSYSPKLTVRTKSESRQILIEIEDNGPGISDDIKDKILQPFFTTKKGTQGTGLGLSITHDIIKAHGGFLHINSEPGKTIFRIQLPA